MERLFSILILALFMAVSLIACGSDSSPALVSIEVTPAGQTIKEGNSLQYTATGTYSDGSTKDLTTSVLWRSSDETAATIDAKGLLTATAASGDISGSTAASILCVAC